jgi:Ca2+-binding RTX toxin-like protein
LTVTGVGGSTGSAVIYVWAEDLTSSTPSLTVNFKAGGNANDTLIGTDDVDMLFGENGDDTLDGRGGNDLLCGGRGNDTLIGGGGADHFGGGQGTDRPVDFSPQDGDTKDQATP